MPNDGKVALSVVVPAFDEAPRIADSLRRIVAWLAEQPCASEVLVVDDGSRDGTFAIACEVGRGAPLPVEVVRYPRNGGKGLALKVAFARARGERILFSDADLAVPIEEAARLLQGLDAGYDVAIASRHMPGATLEIRQPRLREFMGATYTRLVRLLIGPVSDATCGFKAYRGEVGRDLFGRTRIFDWGFDAELLWLMRARGYRMIQVPVVWRDRTGTRVRLRRDVLRSGLGLLRIRWNALRGRYAQPAPVHPPLEIWRHPES